MNNRRKLIVALGTGALAAPLAPFAQPAKELPRIGYLGPAYFDMFQQQMKELGYIDGGNIHFERRDAEGRLEQIPVIVGELVQQKVRVLVMPYNFAIEAARKATATIPIVMVASIDPVAAGFVATLARPGGNISGLATLSRDLSAKRIEILREMFPRLARLAVLWDADGPGPKIAIRNYEAAAQAMKVRLHSLAIRGPKPELAAAFLAAKAGGAEAVIVVTNPTTFEHRETIMALARKHRLGLMGETEMWANDSVLTIYGPSYAEISRRLAVYVDKILKGARPADLPVEQPTKFDFVINQKTAKALGIKFPSSILLQATRVIE